MRPFAHLEPNPSPGRHGVVFVVEAPPRKQGCCNNLVTLSTVAVGGQAPAASTLGRLADKARLALGLLGEGKEPRIVARIVSAIPVAGEEAKGRCLFTRVLNAKSIAEEAKDGGIFAPVLNVTTVGCEEEAKDRGIFARVLNPKTVAGEQEAKDRGIFAPVLNVSTVACDEEAKDRGIFARVLNPKTVAGEQEAKDRGIFARVLNATLVAGEEQAKERGIFVRIFGATPVVGEDAHVFVRAPTAGAVSDEDARLLYNLAPFCIDGEESFFKARARASQEGKAGDTRAPIARAAVVVEDAHLLDRLSSPALVAGPGFSSTRARPSHEGKAGDRLPFVEGHPPSVFGLRIHSGVSRLAVATMGAVATHGSPLCRRSFCSITSARANQGLGERVTSLELRADTLELASEAVKNDTLGLKSETTALIVQAAELEIKMKSVRTRLAVVQAAVGGAGLFLALGSGAIWWCWDSKWVRAFFVEQALLGLNEYRLVMWENSKKKLTYSNVSDTFSRWTGGYLGSSFDEQRKSKERQMAEWQMWQQFLSTRRANESFIMSAFVYKLKEIGWRTAQRRLYEEELQDAGFEF